jgi:hypothetical protein
MDKKIRIKKYNKHPEVVGDEIEVTIMNNEKIEPKMKHSTTLRKPKQPRMTINQLAVIVNNLAIEMRAGFAAINKRIDHLEVRIDKIEETLERHEEILKRHELIFERNNLK